MNKVEKIKAGVRNIINANKIKSDILKRLASKKNEGETIIKNLTDFLKVSGRTWKAPKISQNSIISEFTERLKMFLQTTNVKYENDLKLHIFINGQWYELTKSDWVSNLPEVLKEIEVPIQFVNTDLVSKLYLKIVDVFKDLDPDFKAVSKLLI
ncbi:MAG: hypothetical protein PF485_11490 [Bacteroidales bacterium]|jgi:hypothetical protein|nr:hypothetical protein [Bacteroidales bacterium]